MFANSWPSASNFKIFSRSLEKFFLAILVTNFHLIQFRLKEYNKSVLKIATNKAVFGIKVAVQSYETQFMALD